MVWDLRARVVFQNRAYCRTSPRQKPSLLSFHFMECRSRIGGFALYAAVRPICLPESADVLCLGMRTIGLAVAMRILLL